MRPNPCFAPHAAGGPSPRLGGQRLGVRLGLLCSLVVWFGHAAQAHADVRRRPQREVAADSATPAPAYGEAARGLGRARKGTRRTPVQRRAAAPVVRNDSGDDEAIEEIETDGTAVVTSSEGPESWWGDAWPVWDRVMDAYTARPVRKRTVNTLISHRSSYGIGQDPLFNAFGIDGFSNVGLSVRVGLIDQLDLGIERWGNQLGHDTYEFDLRGQLLGQDKFAIDLGLRAGLSWFVQKHANDAVGYFAELLIGRLFFSRLYTGFNLLYHSSSSGPFKTDSDSHASMAVQLVGDWRVTGGLAVAVELTPAIAGYHLAYPVLTVGPRFITNRHTFAVVLSNSSYFSTDAMVANTDRINPKYWKLGFHLTREL